ncbi:sialate O-acetylesterase [Arenibacter sp. F20364]|jgi:hypothetical protein|uniref:sialate O-acetylesterase n=1 Tax=Arenibacter sp. F20364 TaxID=2926415 RepID=UPI001FF6A30C|nr:sialate O-acetylesterase [Arenibacter sp. F20364]MCK0190686.1 sialate O-acetylesterase [Arenibacter sp. F20364]
MAINKLSIYDFRVWKWFESSLNLLPLYVLILMLSSCNVSKNNLQGNNEPLEKNPEQTVWVYLMAGQSNMAGRGAIEAQDTISNPRILSIDSQNNWVLAKEPLHFYENSGLDCGMSFAREMLKHVPDSVTIALVPCAVGGSSIYKWLDEDSEHRGVKLLRNFKQKVDLAKARGEIKGILWHQGESNANEKDIPVYNKAVNSLFEIFRAEVGDADLPIVMGELGRFAKPEEKAFKFQRINQVIRSVAENDKNTYWVSSKGLDHKGDNLQFNSVAQRKLGKRYAEEMLKTMTNKTK